MNPILPEDLVPSKRKRFALVGAAGFVAPRHLDAIASVGGHVTLAFDPHDSVGILDRYSLDVPYVTSERDFERALADLRDRGQPLDYVVVCSPNDRHLEHILLALHHGARVICEKPLVRTARELESLLDLPAQDRARIHPILQLREQLALSRRHELESSRSPAAPRREVQLDYVTARGPWYARSWKGDVERSGGLLLNIGIHFLDALLWLFGSRVAGHLQLCSARSVRGVLELERARAVFSLSIDASELPESARQIGFYRKLTIDGETVDLSAGPENLHARAYRTILSGHAPTLTEAAMSLRLAFDLAQEEAAQGRLAPEKAAQEEAAQEKAADDRTLFETRETA